MDTKLDESASFESWVWSTGARLESPRHYLATTVCVTLFTQVGLQIHLKQGCINIGKIIRPNLFGWRHFLNLSLFFPTRKKRKQVSWNGNPLIFYRLLFLLLLSKTKFFLDFSIPYFYKLFPKAPSYKDNRTLWKKSFWGEWVLLFSCWLIQGQLSGWLYIQKLLMLAILIYHFRFLIIQ